MNVASPQLVRAMLEKARLDLARLGPKPAKVETEADEFRERLRASLIAEGLQLKEIAERGEPWHRDAVRALIFEEQQP